GVTSVAVFQNNALVFADAIPIGGNHVTNDIAQILTTSITDAERMKILYGSAMASSTDESEMIDVPRLGEDERSGPNHVPRSLLIGVIQPRLEELFEMIRGRLNDAGIGQTLGRRIVLTGGASQLPGMRDLAQLVLDKQVRLGKPIRLSGLPDAVSGPAFATTAGLLTYISERSDEMPADIMAQVDPGTVWERVKFWLKENW
ncbi:MAG: cell division protein FtsA, partial [Alphaproteobacteria bacterium]